MIRRCDPDAVVRHPQPYAAVSVLQPSAKGDTPAVGSELDRVRKQVEQHLPHARAISRDGEGSGWEVERERVVMSLYQGVYAVCRLPQHGVERERFARELEPARRDLREVE